MLTKEDIEKGMMIKDIQDNLEKLKDFLEEYKALKKRIVKLEKTNKALVEALDSIASQACVAALAKDLDEAQWMLYNCADIAEKALRLARGEKEGEL